MVQDAECPTSGRANSIILRDVDGSVEGVHLRMLERAFYSCRNERCNNTGAQCVKCGKLFLLMPHFACEYNTMLRTYLDESRGYSSRTIK